MPRAALCETEAVCNYFDKKFLFNLLKVLQSESLLFAFHDSCEQVAVCTGGFPSVLV